MTVQASMYNKQLVLVLEIAFELGTSRAWKIIV